MGCGRDKLEDDRISRYDLGIWKDGCVEILRHKMRTEVKTVLMVYTFLGALLAIVELITVVLACAYLPRSTVETGDRSTPTTGLATLMPRRNICQLWHQRKLTFNVVFLPVP